MNNTPLVVHLIYRLDFGGLETLLVECINRMPADRYRHAIVCLTDYTEFSKKITRPGVEIFALHKPPGLGLGIHAEVWKLLRRLRPAVLHTYNLAAAEYAMAAWLAGVPVRIHAEHGRDARDPEGKNVKHNLLRRLLIPIVDRWVPVSADLQRWLKHAVGVPDRKNMLINNGVDTTRFQPDSQGAAVAASQCVIGTVGRIQDVKNHLGLVDAFILLRNRIPENLPQPRLVIVGDGPLLPALKEKVAAAGLADLVWLPGARSDIAELMRTFSVFALPSIAEGTPVTILEAMSAGLPVVATRVGGIPEVVVDGQTGTLVPPSDAEALAEALASYCRQPALAARHGVAGRERVERNYSIDAMVSAYAGLYDALRTTKTKFREPIKSCVE
ncbi:TIGR03088 family PEP-CTERM/XrtA system glycosyltransferase [Noviherbaspirillum cavernae]|uniref:TIGR03088 family PEP-CTERM/XrtA system glycosyltransferase n=2 Tax=Noviherbaspirillum cavernae TaxID=2320862 RepID=A0A418X3N5_9BURK|nr:TIGR03088 family PEP-CTERM/XrtA system glycosyltransferase [Noviherbaspirillum cavernae]RJG07046.1 TIGR03088 family PEP-CTERM/XrtA system glycosyltransferase [Noviherbaspirillum cavernae]